MPTAITNDVKISVEVSYQGTHQEYHDYKVYAYRITIENNSEYTIQLLRRHWYVNDIGNDVKEVEGEGVVGQQPVLEPGQRHSYISSVMIAADFGTMHGYYTMERQLDGRQFRVNIPLFKLIAPYRLN
jgi:ApaG protein